MDRFDEEAASMAKAIIYKELSEPICSYFKRKLSKAYADGQASKTAEVKALKEKVERMRGIMIPILQYPGLRQYMGSNLFDAGCKALESAPPAGEPKEKI